MKNIFLVTVLLVLTPFAFLFFLISVSFSYNNNLQAAQRLNSIYSSVPGTKDVLSATVYADEGLDGKAEKIRFFLARYGSPLEPYAEDIVAASEEFGIDHRLIPAIAMQESGLCKKIPENSYNCWGFGIYGGKVTRFVDYKEGIYIVSKALGVRFKNQGLITPEQIMTVYTPNSNGSWARGVNHFMEQI